MSQDEHRIFGHFATGQTLPESAVLDRRYEGKDATDDLCEKIFSTPPFVHFTSLADGFERMFEVFEDDNLTENYWWLEGNEWKEENK